MTSDELFDLFRSDVRDDVPVPLWSDVEVWNYMNDAYKTFVRLTGGIADTTSALTQVPIVAGVATASVSPLILKFRTAYLLSTGARLTILNDMDLPVATAADYGAVWTSSNQNTPGTVQSVVVGVERNSLRGLVRWVRVPMVDDTCQFSVYRLPKDTVESGFEFDEIGEEHHVNLLMWMKYRAYGKQDAETFDRGRRDEYKAEFQAYCRDVSAEWERYKSKVHVVAYGGL
jgi:hypothetical protein